MVEYFGGKKLQNIEDSDFQLNEIFDHIKKDTPKEKATPK